MNIPFFRFVKYEDDGVDKYQCLMCGETLMVRCWRFSPIYCCFCGVKYQGEILRKELDYISRPRVKKMVFVIQEATIWTEGEELEWENTWFNHPDAKVTMKQLKEFREEEKRADNAFDIKRVYRTTTKYEDAYSSSVIVDTDAYRKRTGKKFNRDEYEKKAG